MLRFEGQFWIGEEGLGFVWGYLESVYLTKSERIINGRYWVCLVKYSISRYGIFKIFVIAAVMCV